MQIHYFLQGKTIKHTAFLCGLTYTNRFWVFRVSFLPPTCYVSICFQTLVFTYGCFLFFSFLDLWQFRSYEFDLSNYDSGFNSKADLHWILLLRLLSVLFHHFGQHFVLDKESSFQTCICFHIFGWWMFPVNSIIMDYFHCFQFSFYISSTSLLWNYHFIAWFFFCQWQVFQGKSLPLWRYFKGEESRCISFQMDILISDSYYRVITFWRPT